MVMRTIERKIARTEEALSQTLRKIPYALQVLRGIPFIHLFDMRTREVWRRKALVVEITSICNVRCVWCPMQTFKQIKLGSMTLDQFTRIIEENKNYLKDNNFSVEPYFRGEPLLHPNFWEICEVLKRNGIKNGGINTNFSVKIDIEKFSKYRMECLLVTIGGTTKEVHENIMRGSDFELVTSNLRKVWSMGVPALIKMNPTKLNVHQLKELPRFVESLSGKREYIVPTVTSYPPIPPQISTQEQVDFFFENVVSEEVSDYLSFNYDLSQPDKDIRTKTPGCHALVDTIFFDGQYSICCHDQFQMINLGNVFETTIAEIRNSEKYARALETAKRCGFSICKRYCSW